MTRLPVKNMKRGVTEACEVAFVIALTTIGWVDEAERASRSVFETWKGSKFAAQISIWNVAWRPSSR